MGEFSEKSLVGSVGGLESKGEWMHDRIPDSELVGFAESGHSRYSEEPEKFNAAVTEFVTWVVDSEPLAAD